MKLFGAWFKSDKLPEGADALMRVAANPDDKRRRPAIYALAWVQFTDKVFTFLQTLLHDPPVADAAIYSLGKSGDPRGKALALKIARSGGPLARAAAESIDFDLRSPAELLEVAMKSESYHAVEKAVKALSAWETPEAEEALKTFRAGICRNLDFERIDPLDSTGEQFEGEPFYTVRSSRDLGQQPTPKERELERKRAAEAHKRQVFADLLNLGRPEDVAEFTRQCLENPGANPGFSKLRTYLEHAGNNATAAELRRQLDQGDKSKLKQYLLDRPGNDAVALLELLGCPDLWPRLLESESRFWHGRPVGPREATMRLCARFPEEMSRILLDVILAAPISSPTAVAAAGALGNCRTCAAPQLEAVLGKLRPLLADVNWNVRRQALTVLLPIKFAAAKTMLREYLTAENDFELQTLAKEFLEAEVRK